MSARQASLSTLMHRALYMLFLLQVFFGIGQALGPAIGGYLADASGSFTLPFLIAGVISLVGMVLSIYLKKPAEE